MRHFLSLFDVSTDEIKHLLREAVRLKKKHLRGSNDPVLRGKTLGLVFEKPSLRTRVSFETAMLQLGGGSLFISGAEVGFGVRESVPDIARTLSQYVDVIALRTFKQATIDEIAIHATVPVVNALSDYSHPCQALGDVLTMMEELDGELAGRTVVFVGDGNNVARSLATACGHLGVRFVLAAPQGYGFDAPFLKQFRAALPGAELEHVADAVQAVRKADVIYTDVWTSMGQEAEQEKRKKAFTGYQVNSAMLAKAPSHALVMHCLPAHRGEEISAEVMDEPRCVVFPQAGNRMHIQKALLLWLLADGVRPRKKAPEKVAARPAKKARGR